MRIIDENLSRATLDYVPSYIADPKTSMRQIVEACPGQNTIHLRHSGRFGGGKDPVECGVPPKSAFSGQESAGAMPIRT